MKKIEKKNTLEQPNKGFTSRCKSMMPIGVSLLVLLFLYSRIDPRMLLSSISSSDPVWAVLYILLACLEPAVRATRWKALLGRGAYKHILLAMYIGKACNNLFPLRMGDAVRLQYLRDKTGHPYRSAVASVIGETLLDLVFLSIISATFALVTIQQHPKILFAAVGVFLLVGLAVVVVTILSKSNRTRIGFMGVLHAISVQMKHMISGKRGAKAVAATALLWLYTILIAYCGLRIMLPDVTATGVLGSIVLVYFAALIPSAPGFIGSYHAAVAVSIGIMGYHFSDYASLPIVVHALQFIPQVIIGLIVGIRYIRGNDWHKAYTELNTARRRLMRGST